MQGSSAQKGVAPEDLAKSSNVNWSEFLEIQLRKKELRP